MCGGAGLGNQGREEVKLVPVGVEDSRVKELGVRLGVRGWGSGFLGYR